MNILATLAAMFAEIVCWLLWGIAWEWLFRGAKPLHKSRDPIIRGLGYLILGILAGALSLLIFSKPFIDNNRLQLLNLLVGPLLVGISMSVWAKALERFTKRVSPIAGFFYGAIFTLGIVLVRYHQFVFSKTYRFS
jgi:hypothetical protein